MICVRIWSLNGHPYSVIAASDWWYLDGHSGKYVGTRTPPFRKIEYYPRFPENHPWYAAIKRELETKETFKYRCVRIDTNLLQSFN